MGLGFPKWHIRGLEVEIKSEKGVGEGWARTATADSSLPAIPRFSAFKVNLQ